MLKRKRIAAIALAASIGFNFSNTEIIVKADEKLQDYVQENLVEETNDIEKEDNILEECFTPVLNNENFMEENLSDEINNCELENINLDNNTSYDENKQIEINEEQVKLQDEETYYEELQSINEANTDVTWGEDENYSWSNSKCTIYNITFRINDDNATVTIIDCNTKKSGTLTLPNKIKVSGKHYNVTSIGTEAFEHCSSLSSITIPNSVTSIGRFAFGYCRSLSSITIPNSVTSIGDYAFLRCRNLSSITIPNSITSIGVDAFLDCSSLSSIIIPNSVTSIGSSAFEDCRSLSSITIPNSVISIGEKTFYNCSSLSSIKIPNSVIHIGNFSFKGCSSLSSIIIPNSVTSIGSGAFEDCSSLSSIAIPNSVTSIDYSAFSGCNKLNSIWTSQSQYNKFKYQLCYSSDPVLIESNLYNREDYKDDVIKIKADDVKCFERCSDGSKKEIASKRDSEGYFIHDPSRAEVGTKYYTYEAVKNGVTYESPEISVEVSEDTVLTQWNNDLFTENNITYLKTSDNTASIKSCESTVKGKVVLPNKIIVGGNEYAVTSIIHNAFNKCYDLESVIIGDGIQSIGAWAFCECNNLKKVDIANSVTSIDTGAFALCGNLEQINLPNNIKEILSFTFNGCTSLESIELPESVETVEQFAFINCSDLKFLVSSEITKNALMDIGIEEDNNIKNLILGRP